MALRFKYKLVIINLLFCFLRQRECFSIPVNYRNVTSLKNRRLDAAIPIISPSVSPQPFLPLPASSPLAPFTNSTVPKLSGLCTLNFTAAKKLMSVTSTDCWAVFAPFLANVVCCPQFEATLHILLGQSSKVTSALALNGTDAKNCLSDIGKILVSQGASDDLNQICAVHPSNLTEGSCPVIDVFTFESTVDTSKLLAACRNVDPVKECCEQVCQSAILEASTKIALKASDVLSVSEQRIVTEHSTIIDDCKSIVFRWLASKLDPLKAKEVLRRLSSCNINKFCPLVFPDMKNVAKSCGNGMSNQTACCNAMESYVSHLQKQSFITNLQALDCAASMGMKLQKYNITRNIYSLCHISLKDFSLQVGNKESGCLLPSLPSDATFDKSTGISFLCDLNDNIPAPWPSSLHLSSSFCNKTIKIPALPAATSGQSGPGRKRAQVFLLSIYMVVLIVI